MKITIAELKKMNAEPYLIEWFGQQFGEEAELSEVLKRIEEHRESNFQIWLAENFKLSGVYRSWNPSGQREEESTYKNGKRHGLYREWHENGDKITLTKRNECENGKLLGEYTYENGVKITEKKESQK